MNLKMNMHQQLLLFLLLLADNPYCNGQDTFRIEKSIHYSSRKYPVKDKKFHYICRYAREDIVFSPLKKRVEYCYYYDGVRNCHGRTYEILNDSVLQIWEAGPDSLTQLWCYRKMKDDLYEVWRQEDNLLETGFALSLIPLQVKGKMAVRRADQGDTLWQKDYATYDPHKNSNLRYEFYKTAVTGPVYPIEKLDRIPLLFDGETLSALALKRTDYCFCEPVVAVRSITFVVDTTGDIKNITLFEGRLDTNYCPFYLMEITKKLLENVPLQPGETEGKKVNTRYYLDIDMMDDFLNKHSLHPAFDRKRSQAVEGK